MATPASQALDRHISRGWLIDTLSGLVRLKSVNPPGNEAPVAEFIAARLAQAGLEAAVQPLGANRANVLARLPGRGRRPALMFCGHLDTVPFGAEGWTHDPLEPVLAGDRMYGRGTADMKGGLTALLAAVIALAQERIELAGDLVFAGTAGEEVDCLGARRLLAQGGLSGTGALVIAEPTDLALGIAHRGALWLQLTTRGKAAHGSMPHLGVNAIGHMGCLLAALERHAFQARRTRCCRPPP